MNRIIVGVDPAMSGEDRTYISIFDATERKFIGEEASHFQQFTYLRDHIRAVASIYSPAVIVMSENSMGAVTIESLQAEGLPVRSFCITRANKQQIMDHLALAIERGNVSLRWKHSDALVAMALALWTADYYGKAVVDFV